jgi:ATP-dependent Clp protease ATP-binding subunit ClpA
MEILHARRLRLERHHNVVITDDALRAAVVITDQHQTDRRRPDRAIDALDEACAHLQAVARYSPEAEQLIARRRALLRQLIRQGGGDQKKNRQYTPSGESPDEVSAIARDGFAALERFGAELEAMFVGAPSAPRAVPVPGEPVVAPPLATPRDNDDLASLDGEIRQHLLLDGIVVRGADIARVVTVATGHQVTWIELLQSA